MPAYEYSQPPRRFVDAASQSMVESPQVPRSTFTGRKTITLPMDAGVLVPFLVDEILPGDHMKYHITPYLRMSTPLFPQFSGQQVDTHIFFVPCRLVWNHWEQFIAGSQPTGPAESVNYTIPYVESPASGFTIGSVYDLMGIGAVVGQVTSGRTKRVNALPLRCYNLIYREWFRDQNLQTAPTITNNDGPDTNTWYTLLRRGKPHDYFTSALPWPQKFTAPNVPVLGTAPVSGLGTLSTEAPQSGAGFTPKDSTGIQGAGSWAFAFDTATPDLFIMRATGSGGSALPDVRAELALATGVSINQLRQTWMVQQYLERQARTGTRYTEHLRGVWKVNSLDARLQRPEYIGGGTQPLHTTPIAQTAPTTGVPLGALGAVGTSSGEHHASYAATEHGYVIGILSVRSELVYQQGVHRLWTRSTPLDFALPDLAHLGEQGIRRDEIYAVGGPSDPEDTTIFGYQERYHEYRAMYSEVRGILRSRAASNIDEWHLGQDFATPPVLDTTFIQDTPPMARILAAGGAAAGQQYLANILVRRDATRALPVHGTPAQLGRF